jgi:multisubunit Na+/H+ antiporter MnhC subunit
MISVLAPLAGLLVAAAVYLMLSPQAWQRLVGIALLGQALPLLILAAGGVSAQTSAVGLAVALIAFALFLAQAAALRTGTVRAAGVEPRERA